MNTLNFAIWASKNNKILFPKKYNQNKLHIKELHVNLWKLKNVDFAIDIGLMLKKHHFLILSIFLLILLILLNLWISMDHFLILVICYIQSSMIF